MTPPTIHVEGHDITVAKLEKDLFPQDHFSKGDMLVHYLAVAEAMVPHLAGRPLSLRRYPNGIAGDGFFQKNASDYFPDWINTVEVPHRRGEGTVRYVSCDDIATLVYLANLAAIEFHIWTSTVDRLEYPDRLVIDLDPPAGVSVAALRSVARRTRDLCTELGLTPFVQATGGRGYHVVAPLDRSADFPFVRALAGDMADHLAAHDPDLLTTAQRKQNRGGRIFLDTGRNGHGQTFVAPYSLRARPGASVATPLDWSELGRSAPNGFTATSISRRLARKTDPWADMDEHASAPARARERLDAIGGRAPKSRLPWRGATTAYVVSGLHSRVFDGNHRRRITDSHPAELRRAEIRGEIEATMRSGLQVAGAIGVGYLLGRRRKTRLALALSLATATGWLSRASGALKQPVTEGLTASTGLGKLTEPSKRLLKAGRSAASGPMEAVSERLHDRAEAWSHPSAPAPTKAGERQGPGTGGSEEETPHANPAEAEDEKAEPAPEKQEPEQAPQKAREQQKPRKKAAKKAAKKTAKKAAKKTAKKAQKRQRRPAAEREKAPAGAPVRRSGR